MIPLNDLSRASDYALLREKTGNVVSSGMFIGGRELQSFEQAFADFCQAPFCIGVGNGTDAIEIVLRTLEIKTGDRVVCAANAGGYASAAINACGGIPVFADIEKESLALAPDSTIRAIKMHRPHALILTHLYGKLAAGTEDILAICQNYGLPLIEDCAQAHGAARNGKSAGTYGAAGTFSFYPTKNLGALGDAGAIVTNNPEIAARAREIRQYGWQTRYHSVRPGRNSRLDEVQATVLNTRLPHLLDRNAIRRRIAAIYSTGLPGNHLSVPGFPVTSSDYVAHLYVVATEKRDDLRQFLLESGVQSEIHYPIPDHQQKWYPALYNGQPAPSLPVTEWACQNVLTLPCFPEITEEEIQTVIRAVQKFYEISP